MRQFPRGAPPAGLQAAHRVLLADLDAIALAGGDVLGRSKARARAAFEGSRPLVVGALRQAQAGLCAFCEAGLPPTNDQRNRPRPTVEHWEPLSVAPRRALDWHNLVLSCASADSCNQARRDALIPTPPPDQHDYAGDLDHLLASARLRVRAAPAHFNPVQADRWRRLLPEEGAPTDRAGGLNLNGEVLRELRRSALKGLIARFGRAHPGPASTVAARRAEAARLRAAAEPPAFVSVQLAWLER